MITQRSGLGILFALFCLVILGGWISSKWAMWEVRWESPPDDAYFFRSEGAAVATGMQHCIDGPPGTKAGLSVAGYSLRELIVVEETPLFPAPRLWTKQESAFFASLYQNSYLVIPYWLILLAGLVFFYLIHRSLSRKRRVMPPS